MPVEYWRGDIGIQVAAGDAGCVAGVVTGGAGQNAVVNQSLYPPWGPIKDQDACGIRCACRGGDEITPRSGAIGGRREIGIGLTVENLDIGGFEF